MKILLMGAELFHADGRTDMTALLVAFSQYYEKSPKILVHEATAVLELVQVYY
jgi:hypothetical protein